MGRWESRLRRWLEFFRTLDEVLRELWSMKTPRVIVKVVLGLVLLALVGPDGVRQLTSLLP